MKNRTEKKTAVVIVFAVVSFMWVAHTLTKNFVSDPGFNQLLAARDAFTADRPLWTFMLRSHIVLAVIALITGPVGTIRAIRQKAIAWHRWNGRIYVLSILLNVIPGLYMAWFVPGSLTMVGFLVLNSLWLATTWLGYIHIRRKNVAQHTCWITRSFFLTYANLIIHLLLMLGEHGLHLSHEASYALAVWGSLSLNLVLAEIALRKKWLT
ncbi:MULTISPECIES: DUF2306 domain-containing protein [unclassified Paenibacillus]|uniref:DUF2306 domain-containing protein n=1 Tax=unclassified Paenibacillus TaxID=185978 RepID=UPI003645CC6C